MSLGQQLRKARTKQGKTQTAIAKEVGVKQPTVFEWETDECRPGIEKAQAVAAAYGVPLKLLLDKKTLAVLKAAGA